MDQILNTPFLSSHKPLELARSLTRSGNEGDERKAVELLDGLRQRYPHVLAIGQEEVLALEECREPDRAEQLLRSLEKSFLNLDEEFLCRWGRLFKDHGDQYMPLPCSNPRGRAPDMVLAEAFYRKSLAKYDQAYRIRFGHYPGINKATLLLLLGTLKTQQTGQALGSSPLQGLLRIRGTGRRTSRGTGAWIDQVDDETVWHPATAGEARLYRPGVGASGRAYRAAAPSSEESRPSRPRVDAPSGQTNLAAFRNLDIVISRPV